MQIVENIGDATVLRSNLFKDSRGFFLKVFNTDIELLKNYSIKQVNYVTTIEKDTLRGLHYQKDQYAESKIFRIIKGTVQLAFVDVRNSSTTFLKSYSLTLNDPALAVIIPKGFATGYCTLSNDVEMLYLSDNNYNQIAESGLLWNDKRLNIQWEIKHPVLSEKDKNWRSGIENIELL